MYCTNCGKEILVNTKFCANCGTAVETATQPQFKLQPQPAETTSVPNEHITKQSNGYTPGFSTKINDLSFLRYQKSTNNWSFLFSIILAAIAAVAFPIYGSTSGEVPWPQSLYYGLGIGGMFIVIALVQIIKRGSDSTWDGVVIDKKYHKRVRHDNDSSAHSHYIEYVVKVRRDNGKVYKHKTIDLPGLYNYYNVGDKVRHHKGFYYYEKYDKSRDTQIICAACMSMNNIEDEICFRCKCPLLK